MSDEQVLFSWGTETEAAPAWEGARLRSWRWSFQVGWCFVSIAQQLHYPEGGGGWFNIREYSLGFGSWQRGPYHAYYDGPNCTLGLGFLHFYWQPLSCNKCMPPREFEGGGRLIPEWCPVCDSGKVPPTDPWTCPKCGRTRGTGSPAGEKGGADG